MKPEKFLKEMPYPETWPDKEGDYLTNRGYLKCAYCDGLMTSWVNSDGKGQKVTSWFMPVELFTGEPSNEQIKELALMLDGNTGIHAAETAARYVRDNFLGDRIEFVNWIVTGKKWMIMDSEKGIWWNFGVPTNEQTEITTNDLYLLFLNRDK